MSTRSADGAARAAYRRSTGSPRGEARRLELLERVTDDLAANGLVDFSLRRAARAAGTTHKVLLYHFDSAEDLLTQAVVQLRERRIEKIMTAVSAGGDGRSLADRVRAMWPLLMTDEYGVRALDQAIGLVMYDPARYAELGREASRQYLPALLAMCPTEWSDRRKREVAELILAAMRGFLVGWLASGDATGVPEGLAALARALDREEAAGE
jgi:AcrR family transcriptional regulator